MEEQRINTYEEKKAVIGMSEEASLFNNGHRIGSTAGSSTIDRANMKSSREAIANTDQRVIVLRETR